MSEPIEERVDSCDCQPKMTAARVGSTVIFFIGLFFLESFALFLLWNNALAELFKAPKFNYFQISTIFLAFKLLFSRMKF